MLRGLSAFPVTPADVHGRVDVDTLGRLLNRLVEGGVDSIGLLGSTGAYPFFTRDERRRAVAAAVSAVAGRVPLLVGVGALRTEDAVALAADARAEGAAAGLLAPVSYTPLLDGEVRGHFEAVAGTGLPLCIYNNPATTHFDVTPGLVAQLAAIPGVVALKTGAPAPDAASDAAAVIQALRPRVPAGFSIGFSVDHFAPFALLAGGDAWYSVMAGIYPNSFRRLTRAAQSGDPGAMQPLYERLEPLWDLCRRYTSFRVTHLATTLAGYPATPPLPVLPLAGAAAAEVRRTLEGLALD